MLLLLILETGVRFIQASIMKAISTAVDTFPFMEMMQLRRLQFLMVAV